MNMVEKQDHPTNHRLGEEGMNMVDSNMVEVEGMDTVEEHFHPDEPPTGSGGYGYGGGPFSPDEPPTGDGGYGYGRYWYGGG
jgi:hypothetical protein